MKRVGREQIQTEFDSVGKLECHEGAELSKKSLHRPHRDDKWICLLVWMKGVEGHEIIEENKIFNAGFLNDRLPYECTGFDWLPFCSNRFPMILRSPALDLAQEFLDSKSDAAMQKNRSILPEKINTWSSVRSFKGNNRILWHINKAIQLSVTF